MENPDALFRRIAELTKRDDERGAINQLRRAAEVRNLDFGAARRLAIQARAIDRNDLAVAILKRAPASLERDMLEFQLRLEMGEPVAAEMAEALNGRIGANQETMQLAGAMHVEGDGVAAAELLDNVLAREAGWIAGHQAAAHIKWQSGDPAPMSSFARAVECRPDDEMLRAAWLGVLLSASDWVAFEEVSGKGKELFPGSLLLEMLRFDGLSNMGDVAGADAALSALGNVVDQSFDATRIRHLMRHQRFAAAASAAEAAVASHGSPECWAWLGAAWRINKDPRADWFYRGDELLQAAQLELDEAALTSLAALLRTIHQGRTAPLGQSPRGGTQTQGPLLKRRDPEIVGLRQELKRAVRAYAAQLPAPDARHPFLSRPRGASRFEGAWSIRLQPDGHHVPHIHSHGWISSALYVDLPPDLSVDPDRKGWFELGVPLLPNPAPVDAIASVAPVRGKLALFPSLFWHGTRPFDHGERLTVAFDVVPA